MKKIKPFLFILVILILSVALLAVSFVMPKEDVLAKSNAMDDIAKLITEEKYDKAIQKIDAYEGKYGTDDLSFYNRAVALDYLGKTSEAEGYLEKCSNNFRDNNADWYFAKGEISLNENNTPYAVQMYQKALEINPNHYESLFRLGWYSLYNDTDCFKAIYYLRSAVNIRDTDAVTLFLLGKAYLNIAEYNEAKYWIDRACLLSDNGAVIEGAKECYEVINEHETKGGLR